MARKITMKNYSKLRKDFGKEEKGSFMLCNHVMLKKVFLNVYTYRARDSRDVWPFPGTPRVYPRLYPAYNYGSYFKHRESSVIVN